jgi:Domain of unknown function (DUF4184)
VPFTLAHPAAILPLRRFKPLRTVPLILGAMAPDFRDYLPWDVRSALPNTHTLRASVLVCVPMCLLVLGALYLLREPLTALLSPRARWLCLSAVEPFGRRASEWLIAPLSILVGVWSHLLWDSFTHGSGWMVRHLAWLRAPLAIDGSYTTVNQVLQYLSSVAGLAVLALWYWRLPVPQPLPRAVRPGSPPAGPVLALCLAAAILIGGVQALIFRERVPSYYMTFGVFLTHGLSWFAVLYLTAGAVLSLEHRHGDADEPR